MMRSKQVASSLQKTYDECYLSCSTAVYFEGQNNEDEALRAWRSALETINYHNAYRVSSTYTPKTETERALQDSIRQLELQCRERVDLLEALRESRKEAQPKDSKSSRKSASNSPAAGTPGWIGNGTVPAVGYTDLSKPPAIPGRPAQAPRVSSESFVNENGAATSSPALRTESHSSGGKTHSRNSSPEKRKILPTTLRTSDLLKRNSKKKDNLKRKDSRPVASQAAGLAWGSVYRSPSSSGNTAAEAAAASSRISISSDPGFRKDSVHLRPSSGDEPLRRNGVAEDTDGREPRLSVQSARRTPVRTTPTQTPTPTHRSPAGVRQQSSSRNKSSSQSSSNPIDTTQRNSFPRPFVKPKPASLRASTQRAPSKNFNDTNSSSGKSKSYGTAEASSKSQTKPTSRPRTKSATTGKPYVETGDDGLGDAVDQLGISENPARRKLRTVTPPSSDQESSGLKSTDADEDDEEEEAAKDKEDSIMEIMNNLPKGIDVNAARQILNDIVVRGDEVHWDDIAGLEPAKKALKEAVVYPFLRPDLFSGLREPARGMLLFGPPGTGKTMLARAVATESKSTFFSISSSTLTSKWHGESEKLVRALFGLAKALAPSIIFVDEIDSLLSSRSSATENEASRRSKTEFLIQWSDLQRAAAGREKKSGGDASRVLVLAATNMPWDIDEAARRRFVRRQYIPLPEHHVREQQLRKLLGHQVHKLNDEDIEVLVHVTEGFSGSDITALAKDAAMGPLRNLGEALLHTPMDQIRPITFQDFEASLYSIRPSVSRDGLREYEEWAEKFGERGG